MLRIAMQAGLNALFGTALKIPAISGNKERPMESFRRIMDIIGTSVDGVGVLIVVGGSLLPPCASAFVACRAPGIIRVVPPGRGTRDFARFGILIAGDLIRTVVVAPTMQNVAVLGLIVLIRTFLSLSLQLEIEGRLPWQRAVSQETPD